MFAPWVCHCGQRNTGPGPCSRCLTAAPPQAAASPPPARQPDVAVLSLAILIALLLIGGAAGAAVVSSRPDGAASPRPEGLGRTVLVGPGHPPSATGGELEQALPELIAFVERARGLSFVRPVKVTLLGDGDFRRRLLDADNPRTHEDREELKTTERVLEALGLLERDVDLEKAVDALFGAAVAGFYDTEADDLVVRGEKLTPGRRVTLVHELVHALQDQHFDIERDDLEERDDEASQGLTALVEGDAVRIERQYLDSLPEREQRGVQLEEGEFMGTIDASTPEVLLQLVGFPYVVGPKFVEALLAEGGQPSLDRAFAGPPTTSEQLLHPERFLSGDGALEVTPPPAGGTKIDEGVLGELGLLLFLGRGAPAEAQAASRGWGGDRYVAWRTGSRTCVRANIVMDTPGDADELVRALRRVAERRAGVTVRGRSPVTLTSCG